MQKRARGSRASSETTAAWGYSDNNFLIPELVSGLQYQKGTYSGRGRRLRRRGIDQRQLLFGASVSQRLLSRWFGRDTESVIGLQGRVDSIPTVGLYDTRARQRLDTIRQDDVDQRSGAGFFQTSIQWSSKLRTVAGLRGDLYGFDVRSNDPANSGARTASLASLKLSVVLGPWNRHRALRQLGPRLPQQRRALRRADPGIPSRAARSA